jgi:mono/diheme cytochrome c family protein
MPASPLSYYLATLLVFATAGFAASIAPTQKEQASGKVNFSREIRPILSNNCFHCHGPDEQHRKGNGDIGLRLDTKEGAFTELDGSFALVPKHPEKSTLLQRILSHDPDEVMPPKKSGKKISEKEVALLKRWIEEGAEYSGHWAYQKPELVEAPAASNPAWNTNPVDRFLFQKMQSQGLHPSPEADRAVLARRLALDLTGLPPTPTEVAAFTADTTPNAYISFVDKLLAKPAFGEHWARLWMDLARYADSAGYPSDPGRSIWAFRDYVIRAFNENKPFDQFTIEQLAGDLLPQPTEEQIVATAFHRNTMTNNEGGTSDEEFRNAAVIDRVNTTWAVWMGSSMACAQCHTHKFDPLTQKEYFSFFAILNQSEDADRNDEAPLHTFLLPEEQKQKSALEQQTASLEALFKTPKPEWKQGFATWDAAYPRDLKWNTPHPSAVRSESDSKLTVLEDGSVHAEVGEKAKDNYAITLPVEAGELTALKLSSAPDAKIPGTSGAFVVDAIRVKWVHGETPGKDTDVKFKAVFATSATGGYEPQTVIGQKVTDMANSRNKGWSVAASPKPQTLTLLLEKPLALKPGDSLRVELDQRTRKKEQHLAAFSLHYTSDARAETLAATPVNLLPVLALLDSTRSPQQAAQALDYYVRSHAPEALSERKELADAKIKLAALKPNTVPIMRELGAEKKRTTKVQIRGNYLNLGDEVAPGTPSVLPPLPAGTVPDRLAMARWLVSPENPLTARVTMNRFWESLFGVGIVRTSEEFGAQGEMPVHPELLDWLALEFVRSGWNVKAMLKLLVNTAAYRQNSALTPELTEADPENRFVARGPRFRLGGEVLRDQALALSGLLSEKMYGKPVRPPKPSMGLSTAFGGGNDWITSTGEDRYRRAIYTEIRRNSPYPGLTTFDAPNREVCTLRRNRTNTPLQALVTLNDPVYIETAQALARRILTEAAPDRDSRIRFALNLALAREPAKAEVARLSQFLEHAHAGFAADPERAKLMATEPLGPLPPSADAVEYATWTTFANVLLNLDEVLMRR